MGQATGGSCISSFSYIKPQQSRGEGDPHRVVYHPFPTSNHNWTSPIISPFSVVYHPFPTSNHNSIFRFSRSERLYIILFLHQTTTNREKSRIFASCISSFSYIKPQPHATWYEIIPVVYHPFPTSNHNELAKYPDKEWLYIILFLHQTTTKYVYPDFLLCCISSFSYIKPQPRSYFGLYFRYLCFFWGLWSGFLCGILLQKY